MPLLLILEGCATIIHDHTFCSPIPPYTDSSGVVHKLGATCDNFLTHNPQTLNETDWEALQMSWIAKGWAIEVTESNAVGDIKKEIELLCSHSPCTKETEAIKAALVQSLARIEENSQRASTLSVLP